MKRGEIKRIAREVGALVEQKNAAYGSSFSNAPKILAVLFPDGIRTGQYADVLLIARILDKLQRIATDRDALGESPYKDIAGYGLLGAWLHEMLKGEQADAASVSAVGVRQRGQGEEQVLHGQVPEGAGGAGAERDGGADQYLRIEEVPDVPAQPHWSAAWKARQDDAGVAGEGLPAAAPKEVSSDGGRWDRWREITSTEDAYAWSEARVRAMRHQKAQRAVEALLTLHGQLMLTTAGPDDCWYVYADGKQLNTYGWRDKDSAWIDAAVSQGLQLEVPR